MELTPQSPKGATTKHRRIRRVLGAFTLPLAGIVLSGCKVPSFYVHEGATETSKSVYHLWQGFSVAAVIIGAFTFALIMWAVLRYRRKGDTIPKQTQYHIPLQLVYTIVPILIVVGLFVSTIVVENKVVAMPPTKTAIHVNAFQWGWGFTYDGQNAISVGSDTATPTMWMPVDTDVKITLTASDVVHGFYVPQFNFSRYALPGVKNQFTLHALKTGTYFGQCAQMCGLYHTIMYFQVKVVTQAQYNAWLATFNTPEGKAKAEAARKALAGQMSAHTPVKTEISRGAN